MHSDPSPSSQPSDLPSTGQPGSAAAPARQPWTGPQGICKLSDWGLIRAHGEDCFKFLHGQLTQNIESLPDDAGRLAGYCSPKGRLLATAVVWKQAADEVWMACSADVLPPTLKRLSMFVMRAKCKLSDISAAQPLWGIVGADAVSSLLKAPDLSVWGKTATAGGVLLRLPDAVAHTQAVARYLFAGPKPEGLAELDTGIWQWLEVHSATARVVAATAEQFVPQMVNLELVGGVNFQKGCFPGQEVVARSQYRGTLKRRAFVIYGQQTMSPGQEVFHSADPGQPAGMVVLAGAWPEGAAAPGTSHAALVELKLSALEGGTLHLGAADGPLLKPGTLPYELSAPESV